MEGAGEKLALPFCTVIELLEQFRLYYELLWLDAAHAVWLVVIPMICVASYCLLTTVARER
jgi:hypothetical protein